MGFKAYNNNPKLSCHDTSIRSSSSQHLGPTAKYIGTFLNCTQ